MKALLVLPKAPQKLEELQRPSRGNRCYYWKVRLIIKSLIGLWSKFVLFNHRGLKTTRKNSLLQFSPHLVYLSSEAKGTVKYKQPQVFLQFLDCMTNVITLGHKYYLPSTLVSRLGLRVPMSIHHKGPSLFFVMLLPARAVSALSSFLMNWKWVLYPKTIACTTLGCSPTPTLGHQRSVNKHAGPPNHVLVSD